MKTGLFMSYCRFTVNGKHPDGKSYMYKIGICVDPAPSEAGCAVVQSQANASGTTLHCIGKVAKSQVARSEFNLLIVITMNNLVPGLPTGPASAYSVRKSVHIMGDVT